MGGLIMIPRIGSLQLNELIALYPDSHVFLMNDYDFCVLYMLLLHAYFCIYYNLINHVNIIDIIPQIERIVQVVWFHQHDEQKS